MCLHQRCATRTSGQEGSASKLLFSGSYAKLTQHKMRAPAQKRKEHFLILKCLGDPRRMAWAGHFLNACTHPLVCHLELGSHPDEILVLKTTNLFVPS